MLQAPLEQPASSTVAPNPSKAPWYFLGLQEMLVYFDPWMAGVVLPTMIIVGLMAIPYIDTNKEGNGYYTIDKRKFAYITFQYGFLVLWVVLILLGTFLRGPNWNFFGPYEFWDLHKLIPLNNVNLSDIVWVQMLGQTKPAIDPSARGARDDPLHALLPDPAARHGPAVLPEVRRAGRDAAVPDPGRPAPVHGEPADQDGPSLDDEPEIPGRDPRVLLQYLIRWCQGRPPESAGEHVQGLIPMPATEETYYRQPTLHVVFAVSSVAMLLSIVWMIMADHLRPWKAVQRDFHQVEDQKLQAAEQEKLAIQSEKYQAEIDKIDQQIKQAEQNTLQRNADSGRPPARAEEAGGPQTSSSTPRRSSRRPSSTASAACTTA